MGGKPLEEVRPPDCYARARLIQAEVELIRQEMGRARDPRPPAQVKGDAPREVYFQALALFRKADRLAYEITGDQMAAIPHAPPASQLRPGHVLSVLDAALREIAEVKGRLRITESAAEPALEPSRVPSDVFGVIVDTNRQLNLLLERPFSPGDVYQQLSLAAAYAQRLLAGFPGGGGAAEAPFERRKRPGDVFQRLTGCVASLRSIVGRSGLTMLEQAHGAGAVEEVLPADCFDMASLVLSELAFLHAHRVDPNPPYPFEANAPGRKLPAHCYQLAGTIQAMLTRLDEHVAQSPGWLKA
jgi:hypothetical protein